MTEADWLTCADPYTMAAHLQATRKGWRHRFASWLGGRARAAHSRKMLLFACACCRRFWEHLPDERSRNAVEACERFVDGLARTKEFRRAREAAEAAAFDAESPRLAHGSWLAAAQARAAEAVFEAFAGDGGPIKAAIRTREVARACGKEAGARKASADVTVMPSRQEISWTGQTATPVVNAARKAAPSADLGEAAWQAEGQAQCDLLRDIFGNPFHPPSRPPAWNAANIQDFARRIYEERAFERLTELARMLEDSGPVDPAIAYHCTGTAPHVRGCWVIDLVLKRA